MKRTGKLIIPGGNGNPRALARMNPYDSSIPNNNFKTAVYNPKASIGRTASSDSSTLQGSGSSNFGSVAQSPLYYDYRWSTPDKFYYPRNRLVANSIWREMYKRDSVVSAVTDMYADMPWSEFDLVGIDDPAIRKVYEDMFNTLNLVPKLPGFTRDYLTVGEVVLHTMFNSSKGIWERVIPHNPDYIRAEGVGLISEQPLLWLRPTPEIRRMVNSPDPRVRKLQQILPKELVNAFKMNREVPLDPLNTTFIARLNSSTDIRGQSFYTRLFRIVMYEDFVTNASLAVAHRNAAPLRLFKMGSASTNWLPSDEDEQAFVEMLSMAESDPLAAIVTHYDVTCDLVGVSDRVLLISREWEFIERVKLLAMGVAKSFLVGEASFASSIAGLQTLLERLATLRAKFEKLWMIHKLCEPLAEMHDFYERPQSEIDHKIRVQRSDERKPIVPKIKWRKSLEAAQDPAILTIWRDLHEKGILSDRTYASGASADLEVERKNKDEEREYMQQQIKEHPELQTAPPAGGPGAPTGGPPKFNVPSGLPPGASRHAADAHLDMPPEFISELETMTNQENMIHIDDVIRVVDSIKAEKTGAENKLGIAEYAFRIPSAGKGLLAGDDF